MLYYRSIGDVKNNFEVISKLISK